MSSTTGLSRSRSLRKPAANGNEQASRDELSSAEARTTSPSRLPQARQGTRPSASRPASAAASTTTTATTRTRAPPSTSRPPLSSSSVFAARPTATATTRRASPTRDPPPKTTSTRPRAPSTRQATSAAGPSTTTAAARPPSSSGTTASSTSSRAKTLGHSRAKSTTTATTLTPATTLRPPSSSSSSANPSSATTSTQTTTNKLPSRSHTHRRNVSQPSNSSSAIATQASSGTAVDNRPAFNTNQQHYSPLKVHAPKPLTSTYLAPPSPSKLPANVAISAETSRLQAELLQLSLLHRDAEAVTAEWHASARYKLGTRFAQLVERNEDLGRYEREGIGWRNVASLARWGEGRLDDKAHGLDEVVGGLWGLSEPGGRYERVVAEFEEWAQQVEGIVSAQRGGRADRFMDGGEMLFVSDLERPWKRDGASLSRKLEAMQAKLAVLGSVPEEDSALGDDDGNSGGRRGQPQMSNVGKVLSACTSMVDDMLAELAIMADIEQEALDAELVWIENMNEELRLDDTQDNEVPLWRMAV